MKTQRKWLFWISFFVIVVFLWGFGVSVFDNIKNNWLDDASIEQLRQDMFNEDNFNENLDETVFTFNEVVRFFAYLLLGLVLLALTYFLFSIVDSIVSFLEEKVIDSNLEKTQGKYGYYSGKRI